MINSKAINHPPTSQNAVINNITRTSAYPDLKANGAFLYGDVLWPVMPAEHEQNTKIMNSLFRTIDQTYRSCSRFLAIRYDFHQPQYSPDNQVITLFHQQLIPMLRQVYPNSFVRVFWVREQDQAAAQHYHYLLMVDGNVVRHPHKINQLVKAYWESTTGGTTWLPKHGYYRVSRDDTEALTALLLRVSYFAKQYSKTHIACDIALSGTQYYPRLKKIKRSKPTKVQLPSAATVPAQTHSVLPDALDSPFTDDATPLLCAQIEALVEKPIFRSKALLRALRRLLSIRGNEALATSPKAIKSGLSPHWLRHFERYYREYWPCNISVAQYCHWHYLNPSTASRYLCNYPANLINPWLLKPWL